MSDTSTPLSDTNPVVTHVAQKLRSAWVDSEPFPHFFVDNIFPVSFYRDLLDHLPDPSRYQKLSDVSDLDQDYFQHRDQASLTSEWVEKLADAKLRSFWTETMDWLLGPDLRTAAVELFAPYMDQRYPEGGPLPQMVSEAELIRHRAHYCLEPHTDLQSKVVVVLLYLPDTTGNEQLGTSVYRARDPHFTCEGGELHPFKDFELVKTAPFAPNSAFGFLKSNRSFHGVEPISEEDGGKTSRDIIEWVVYDSAHQAALRAS